MNNLEMNNKREALKAQITANSFQPLIQIWTTRLSTAIFRVSKVNMPPEFLQVLFTALILGLSIGLTFVFNMAPDNGLVILGVISVTYILILQITFEYFIRRILNLIRYSMLDSITSPDDFGILEDFLTNTFSPRRQIIAGVAFTVIAHGLFLAVNIDLVSIVGWPLLITHIFFNFFHGILVYYFFCYLTGFLGSLRGFQFELFESNPSASEIVRKIDATLNIGLYMMIFFGTILSVWMTFAIKYSFPTFSVILTLVFLWLSCVLLFVFNKSTISVIIRKGKWQSLNKIQTQISNLLAKDVVDTQTLEQANKLLEYHDRVLATPDTIFNWRSIFDLANSFLIPGIGYLISEYNNISSVFKNLGGLF